MFFSLSLIICTANAQNWYQEDFFPGTPRSGTSSFVIENMAFIGLGEDQDTVNNDFWSFNDESRSWQQITDFPAAARRDAIAFSIGDIGYVGLGENDGTYFQDFYSYDPTTDDWDTLSNFGGSARTKAVVFVIGGFAYVGTGLDDSGETKDFWKYDPSDDSWSPVSDLDADQRKSATGFSIADKGYVVAGVYIDGGTFQLSDIQEYDPVTDQWTEKIFADGLNLAFIDATAFVKDNLAYILYGNQDHVVTYDPVTNEIVNLGDVLFLGDNRSAPVGISIGSNSYFGLGLASPDIFTPVYKSDWWRFGLIDPPEAPSSLSLENSTGSEVEISWDDNSFTETSFTIERAILDMAFEEIGEAGINQTSFVDTNVVPGVVYSYRVAAINEGGQSPYSNILEIQVPNSAPTGISLAGNSISEVAPAGTVVGRLVLIDPDKNDQGTFQLTSGNGDTDNASFVLENDLLTSTATFEFIENQTLSIRVRGTDLSGESFDQALSIEVRPAFGKSRIFVPTYRPSIESLDLVTGELDTLLQGHRLIDYLLSPTDQAIYWLDMGIRALRKESYDLNESKTIVENLDEGTQWIYLDEAEDQFYFVGGRKIYTSARDGSNLEEIYDHDFNQTGGFTINYPAFDRINKQFFWVIGDSLFQVNPFTGFINSAPAPGGRWFDVTVDEKDDKVFWYSDTSLHAHNISDIDQSEVVVQGFDRIRDFTLDSISNKIYIVGDTAGIYSVDIYKMNYDGSEFEKIFEGVLDLDEPEIDLINQRIYVVSRSLDRIVSFNLQGDDPDTLFAANFSSAEFKLDPENDIIVINYDNAGINGNRELSIATIDDTTTLVDVLPVELDDPIGLFVDEEHGKIYYPEKNRGTMHSMNLDGTGDKILFDGLTSPGHPTYDPNNAKIYWVMEAGRGCNNGNGASIWRSNLDGSDCEVIVPCQDQKGYHAAYALDAEGQSIYWYNDVEFTVVKHDIASNEQAVLLDSLELEVFADRVLYRDGNLWIQTWFDDLYEIDLSTDSVTKISESADAMFPDFRFGRLYFKDNQRTDLRYFDLNDRNVKSHPSEFGDDFTRYGGVYSLENESPTSISLSNNSIIQNRPDGQLIGILETEDPNEGDTHTYEFLNEEAYEYFTIEGNELLSGTTFVFSQQPSYDIMVSSMDPVGGKITQSFTIFVDQEPGLQNPTDILLTNNEIQSYALDGELVGILSSVDPDTTEQTFTYDIEPNDYFRLGNVDNLFVMGDLNVQDTIIEVTITTTDQTDLSFTKSLDIVVLENNPPTNITLSNNQLKGQASSGTVVGEFSTDDPDLTQTHQYTIPENDFFEVEENRLLNIRDDLEDTVITIMVTTADPGGLIFTKEFEVIISEVLGLANEKNWIYPNPTSGLSTIKNVIPGKELKIYDLNGVVHLFVIPSSNELQIDLRQLDPGIYLVLQDGWSRPRRLLLR